MKRLIKRYGGRRLYDCEALAYTTAALLRARADEVVIVDARTGENVTREVLGQG